MAGEPKKTDSDQQIAELKAQLQEVYNGAKAPPPKASESIKLSPEQRAEQLAQNQQTFIRKAQELFQQVYSDKHAEINAIPPMMSYFKNHTPEQVTIEIDKRAQVAGLKAGIAAVSDFVSKGGEYSYQSPNNSAPKASAPAAEPVAAKPAAPKMSSADLQSKLGIFKATPPPLPTAKDFAKAPSEAPPLLSRVNQLGEAGAKKELQDQQAKAAAEAKADLDAMPPMLSSFNKRR